VIPQIVMNKLPVPQHLPRRHVQSHQRIAIEVRSFAVASVIVVGGLYECQIHDAALRIDGEDSPDIDPSPVFPRVAGPCVVIGLTGLRNAVKTPRQFPRAEVPRPDIAHRPATRTFWYSGA